MHVEVVDLNVNVEVVDLPVTTFSFNIGTEIKIFCLMTLIRSDMCRFLLVSPLLCVNYKFSLHGLPLLCCLMSNTLYKS